MFMWGVGGLFCVENGEGVRLKVKGDSCLERRMTEIIAGMTKKSRRNDKEESQE